jgi:signal transduction histidine kinase
LTTHKVDAAVLKVLAAFAAFLWLMLLPTAVAFVHHDAPEHAPAAVWCMLGCTSLLLVYLLSPQPQRWLHRYYLPLALVTLSLIPFVGELLSLHNGPAAYGKLSLEFAFVLFVPLFVCAWQYGLRPAVLLTLAATVADLALSLAVASPTAELFRHVVTSRAAVFLAAAYITARLVDAQRAQHASLREANRKLAAHALTLEQLATSHERHRIAREIHDTLAHTLSALAVQLEAIRALWTSEPDGARTMVERSLATTRSGLCETRRTLQALRASPIEDLGLELALRSLAENTVARTDAVLTLDLPSEPLTVPAELEHGIYRIAEEALENVVRHAGARKLALLLQGQEDRLELRVTDSGRGFDVAKVPDGTFGLHGMHERANMLGGALSVESTPGQGTTVRFSVSVAAVGPSDLGSAP